MLVDHEESSIGSGGLDRNIHLPSSWFLTLLEFILVELPKWRDDPARPAEMAEDSLTSRFCAHLNSAVRMSVGWDFLQFRPEDPDDAVAGRKLDLVPAPCAAKLTIEGREYTHYKPLIPIECKRLPTPKGTGRDVREYLYSDYSSTGGVQRFKAGHHGSVHSMGAMIGYVQAGDIDSWNDLMCRWVEDLAAKSVDGWSDNDKLELVKRDSEAGSALLKSVHVRKGDLPDIELQHLWIDMGGSIAR